MFKTIVIAVDGSEPSERALQTGCGLAKAFGGEVHLVHALENRSFETPLQSTSVQGDLVLGSDVMDRAVTAAKAMGVTPASTTIGEGEAFPEIMTIAELYGADLIVTGRRGLGNIGGLLAGSTSQQIAKYAKCAFLSVK
jgi:nucleotide-binding universal stress UspA family protein